MVRFWISFCEISHVFQLKNSIDEYMGILPDTAWPSFYLDMHGQQRVASRHDPFHVNTLNMLLLMLPGTPITYAGEEAGMNGRGKYLFSKTKTFPKIHKNSSPT